MNRLSLIKDAFRKQYALFLILITSVYCIYYINENRWKGTLWQGVIGADGFGYYAYLPCVFIHHSFDFHSIIHDERINHPDTPEGLFSYTFPAYSNGKNVDKCFAGVALLIMPFFLIAYFLSFLFGFDTVGGYSFLFAASVSIAGLFYMTIGLIFIRKLLKLYSIPEYLICIVILLAVFGTNLFYYVTMEQSLGHVYSFGMNAIFLFYVKRAIDDRKLKYMILMTFAIGILVIIRPTNVLSILMIPFLAGSWKKTIAFISEVFKPYKFVILFCIYVSVLFIQFTCWKIETGHFFIWSYPNEGFNFKEPHFFDILLSYRKGWFVYTPLMFIAITGGLITLFKQNKFTFLSGLLFFTLVTYVLSSWDGWWYGASFSGRPFVDFYSSFLLLLGIFLRSLYSVVLKISIFTLCSLCLGLNMLQIYQRTNFILPYDGMTKEKYWKIFLKTSNLYGSIFDYPDTTAYKYTDSLIFKNDFENNTWGNDKTINSIVAHSYSHSALINSEHHDSPEFIMDASKVKSIKNLNIYINLWAYMTDFDSDAKVLVYVKNKEGNATLWVWRSLQGFVFKKTNWTQAYYIFQLPELKEGDKIHALINHLKALFILMIWR